MPRLKIRGRMFSFFDEHYYQPGLKGFRSEEPGAYYTIVGLMIAPVFPVVAWAGYSLFGYNVFEHNASNHIGRTSYKSINVFEPRTGRNDVGEVYVYEYSDGTKEVKYTRV